MPDTHLPEPSITTAPRSKTTKSDSSASTDQPGNNAERRAHFVLQGKGGAGKSFIASLITQYLTDKGRLEALFDTDPVNGSIQKVKALNAKEVELLNRNALNVKAVDQLIEHIVTATKDIVVDNGAASFLPLSRYLIENDIAGIIARKGAQMVVHTVVNGGGNGMDTLKGLDALIRHFAPAAEIVCWVNEFFGPARFEGVDFEQTKVYLDNQGKLLGLVYLRKLDPEMFEPNLLEMLERKMTFAEAAASDHFMLMEKSRLSQIKQDIWDQLDRVL
ncbi:MAG: hypothetical protein JOY71_24125 [Acetobacteraceae bacterium]|nr:hypothetical protein [Acetobacteraceae bacterium]